MTAMNASRFEERRENSGFPFTRLFNDNANEMSDLSSVLVKDIMRRNGRKKADADVVRIIVAFQILIS